jgi:hypothetical protein
LQDLLSLDVMPQTSAKKQEMKTYQKLALSREHKSRARREKAGEEKLYTYIGGMSSDRPYLKVLRSDYEQTRRQVSESFTTPIVRFSQANLADFHKQKIEQTVYDILVRRQTLMLDLDAAFQKKHGRGMTPHERSIYATTLERETPTQAPEKQQDRMTIACRLLTRDLIQKIEKAQKKNPQLLQQAWASAVGEELAQHTVLEKIENGCAICRSLNATVSFQLKREKGLALKLSKSLNVNIKKIAFR